MPLPMMPSPMKPIEVSMSFAPARDVLG